MEDMDAVYRQHAQTVYKFLLSQCRDAHLAEELTQEAPLVLDDALVRFDDGRMAQALKILKEMAKNKQVICFTCQNREKNA